MFCSQKSNTLWAFCSLTFRKASTLAEENISLKKVSTSQIFTRADLSMFKLSNFYAMSFSGLHELQIE
jgi:hypothetical protein